MSPNADGGVPNSCLLRFCLQPLPTVIWLKHCLYRIKLKTISQFIEFLKKKPGSLVPLGPWPWCLAVCGLL